MKRVNLAIVGATGMVGRTFLKVLEERKFPINNLYLFSSEKSAGTGKDPGQDLRRGYAERLYFRKTAKRTGSPAGRCKDACKCGRIWKDR